MAMAMLALSILPMVVGNDTGTGIGINMETEEFGPRLWMCDNRKVIDDPIETGRVDGQEVCSLKPENECRESERCDWKSGGDHGDGQCILKGNELIERSQNYAFEGEKIEWLVLAMDKNKIEEISDVFATIGSVQGEGNDVEVECVRLPGGDDILRSCNARILEEEIDQFDYQTMAYYECTLTVETPESMDGEYFVTVEAMDASGLSATMDENEYWYFNPVIAVSVDGDVDFGIVRPGTISYSETLLVGNDASPGSGVLLDMFISGTDFYDPSSSGARCVITNRLKLGNNIVASGDASNSNKCRIGFGDTDDHLCYYATNGAYGTQGDPRSDAEGYAPIVYGDSFTTDFYDDAEIIYDGASPMLGPYSPGNVLAPGAEIALTFKLGLPEPCVGDFSDGDIYFWGEAI